MDSCPACGTNLDEGATTCPACGAVVHEVTATFAPITDGADAAGSLAESAEGPLLVVRKGPEVGERFYLDRPRLVLGRDPASEIFLNDVTVSRNHATLDVDGPEVIVSDAGSLNGTYVNGVSVDRAILRNGDQLQIGRFQMVFLSGEGD
jgi:pSer/pThr/pTyr-binding forkhead associated (FHA) protein